MDFQKMMEAASKNARKADKEVSKMENQVKDEKSERQKQLEAERRLRIEMQRRKAKQLEISQKRKDEEKKKNFTIPKKDGGVDQNALKAYYEKQEAQKLEKAKQAEKDKANLLKLRMQANGGKATKKIGKHFGLDPVELQIRFGGNNEHVETLQKRKVREDEEADMETEKYRNGVYKAMMMKKKAEETLRNSVKGPHRVSTSKSNSLAGLCSRHEKSRDTFSPPKDGKKSRDDRKEEKPVKKKMQAAPPVDFKSLMAAASHISQGKSVKLDKFEAPRAPKELPKPKVAPRPKEAPRPSREAPKQPKEAPKVEKPAPRKEKSPEPSMIPPFNPNKKYLPGDMRYKMQQQNFGASSSSGASSSNYVSKEDRREIERQREKERDRVRKLKRERQDREDREMERKEKIRKLAHKSSGSRREAELREQQMREKYKKKSSFARDFSDEEEEEERSDEEFDSDLDDFIDDTEYDMDGMSRKEFEETLRMVNRKYDKKKWSQREKSIRESEMSSDYRRIQSEESYSRKAGFIEDLREATKGRSVKL